MNPKFLSLIREKSAGILEGKPLAAFNTAAKKENAGIREFKPEKGENWNDVYDRATQFFHLLVDTHLR